MNEFVYVEFLFTRVDRQIMLTKLKALGDDLEILGLDQEFEMVDDSFIGEWIRVSARARAEYLTLLKLADPYVADRMNVSHIQSALKDRYRG